MTKETDQFTHLPIHPAVELLVARMRSHPQEFYKNKAIQTNTPKGGVKTVYTRNDKLSEWLTIYADSVKTWNRREKRLYNEALREVTLEETHHRLMAKILQGEK